MEGRRDVAGGEHVGRRGPQRVVGDDRRCRPPARPRRRARRSGSRRRRRRRRRPRSPACCVGGHRLDPPAGAAELADDRVGEQVDAVVAVQPGEDPAHLGTEHRVQRRGLRLDDRSPRCRGARAAAATSSPIQPGARRSRPAVPPPEKSASSRSESAKRAQVPDAVEVGARHGQPPGRGAGGQQQLRVGQLPRPCRASAGARRRRGAWRGRRCAGRRRARRTSPAGAPAGSRGRPCPSRYSLDSGGRS